MKPYRKNATIAGILFLIGFTGVPAALLTKPLLGAADFLVMIPDNESRMLWGAFLQFLMASACAGIGITLFPLLRKYNEGLALGSAGFRLMEGMLGIVSTAGLIVLLPLSQESLKAGAADAAYFKTLGVLVMAWHDWLSNVAMILAWCIGALIYYALFYRYGILPRWLAGWGLVGISLAMAASLLVMFQVIGPFSTAQGLMNFPIAVQELVMALWLIVKGFNPRASAVVESGGKASIGAMSI